MQVGSTKVHKLEGNIATDAGHIYRMDLKAWTDDERVSWEVRRLLQQQLVAEYSGHIDYSSWLSHNKKNISEFFGRFLIDYKQHVFPSRLAWQRGESSEARMLKAEYSASTSACVALQMWFMCTKRKAEQRLRAKCFLKAQMIHVHTIMFDCLELNWLQEFSDMIGDQAFLCDEGQDCVHIVDMKHRMQIIRESGLSTPVELVEVLQLSGVHKHTDCKALMHAQCDLMAAVCMVIDEAINANLFEIDPLDLKRMSDPKSKRRRLDEDFKRAVVTKAKEEGRAQSGAHFLRAEGSSAFRLAQRWQVFEMLYHQSAGWRSFAHAKCIGLVSDAARLGDPAEEALVCALWAAGGSGSVVLPPQVHRVSFAN